MDPLQILLVLSLHLANGQVAMTNMPVRDIQECVSLVPEMVLIRQFRGEEVKAVMAGCYVPVPDVPS